MQSVPVPDYLIASAKSAAGMRSGAKAVRHAIERMVRDYERDDGPPSDDSIQLARKLLSQSGKGRAKSLFP